MPVNGLCDGTINVDAIHIDGVEYKGLPDFDATLEPVEEYVKDNIKFKMNEDLSFTATCKVNKWVIFKLLGIYQWVMNNCPNKRVVHLAQYAKSPKTRSKNFNRAIRIIAKTYYRN
jgi:hypothetical protein